MLEIIEDWWSALALETQIFYVLGGIALVVVCIQAVFTLAGLADFGADVEGDFSTEGADAHDAGFGLISVRTITAFFMGFGIAGGQILEAGHALPWAIGGGFVVGAIFTFILFKIMKTLYALRARGNVDIATAKGVTGTVYVAIAPRRAAGGQVEILVSGRVMTLPAVASSDEKIPAGTMVRVVEIIPPNILLVERA